MWIKKKKKKMLVWSDHEKYKVHKNILALLMWRQFLNMCNKDHEEIEDVCSRISYSLDQHGFGVEFTGYLI